MRHGIAPCRDGGTLHISACIDGACLHIVIEDDGAGAAESDWRYPTGFGLHSVQRQLTASFGGAARLDVASAPGNGFRAHLTMPARLPRSRSR